MTRPCAQIDTRQLTDPTPNKKTKNHKPPKWRTPNSMAVPPNTAIAKQNASIQAKHATTAADKRERVTTSTLKTREYPSVNHHRPANADDDESKE